MGQKLEAQDISWSRQRRVEIPWFLPFFFPPISLLSSLLMKCKQKPVVQEAWEMQSVGAAPLGFRALWRNKPMSGTVHL